MLKRLTLGGEVLFKDFRLDLAPGRWTCLLGASGVGKSTLLRAAAGLVPGAVVEAPGGVALRPPRRVALMAQNDLLLPWLDVTENVLLGHRLRKSVTAAARARARDLIGRVGLGAVAEHRPASLSGGMRQRAALARTLMEERPVVLMDEPFSALDAITRHKMQALAADLLRGKTVLLVTHSPAEALRLGHAVFVLEGRPAQARRLEALSGPIPRPADDPALLATQARLLAALAGEAGGAAARCAA